MEAQKNHFEILLRPSISESLRFSNNQNDIYESRPRLSGELMVLFSKPQERKKFMWKAGVKLGLTGYHLMIGGDIKGNSTPIFFDLGVDINYWFSLGSNEFGLGAFASLGSKPSVTGRLETFGETDSFILDFEQGNSLYGLQLTFRRSSSKNRKS